MLSPAQLERRSRGIGASEVPALAACAPPTWRTQLDVWLTKRRGPRLEIEPVKAPDPEPDTVAAFAAMVRGDPRVAGHFLEEAIAKLYCYMTGATARRSGTRTHRRKRWALATPDRDVMRGGRKRGLEIKLVGWRMAPGWAEGPPEYVRLQVQWGMYVTGLDTWDICALVGGSEPRIWTVERDDELVRLLAELCEGWWHTHALGNTPPAPTGPDDAMRALEATFPDDDGALAEAPELEATARRMAKLSRAIGVLEGMKDALTAAMAAAAGPHKGLVGPWGRFSFGLVNGTIDWKGVACELAHDAIDLDMAERHRRPSYRKAQLYPNKRWLERVLGPGKATTSASPRQLAAGGGTTP